MKLKLVLLIVFILGFFVNVESQNVLVYNTKNLFKQSETILNDTNDIPYFVMTNADTAISGQIELQGGRNGDVRISITSNATVGTLVMDAYVGIKVADFGVDSLNYKWILLGNLTDTNNGYTETYLLTDYQDWVAPIIAYKIKLITTSTETVDVKVNVLQWKM